MASSLSAEFLIYRKGIQIIGGLYARILYFESFIIDMNIGEQLKNLRQQNNYTQEQLADLMNVSYQTVSKWERGIVEPDLQTIIRLSTLYRVGVEVILGLTRSQRYERYDELDLKLSELEKSEHLNKTPHLFRWG